jgi:hypothetical protein
MASYVGNHWRGASPASPREFSSARLIAAAPMPFDKPPWVGHVVMSEGIEMQSIVTTLAFVGLAGAGASAQNYGICLNPGVSGYVRGDGTYLPQHCHTNPNSSYDSFGPGRNHDPHIRVIDPHQVTLSQS